MCVDVFVCLCVCVDVCVCVCVCVHACVCACVCTCELVCCKSYSSENISWTEQLTPIIVQDFNKTPGPKLTIPHTVKETFFLFFTPMLLELIVEQSNKYAAECMGEEKYAKWNEITVEELCAYMGFMLLMGVVHLPSLYDYWKKDEVYNYSPVASRISRNRFLELHRYLHFEDNSTLSPPGSPEYDRLGKVRPVVEHLSSRVSAVYEPGKEVSVDEAMIPFKGRSSLKQYMPLKPVRRGIKVWARADASNGYVSAFQVYTGKEGNSTEHGLGAKVVKSLTANLSGSYRHVYFDNYFSSVDLLLDLQRSGLYGCGTLRLNRKGFPPQLKQPAKKGFKERGESKTCQMKNLTVSVWQDNKAVTVISTNSDPTQMKSVTRKHKDGTSHTYPCPAAIADYNVHMGGVDKGDQLRGYYHVRLKCRKYYKYIFWFLFDLIVTNSFILSRDYTDLPFKSVKEFRIALAKELIGEYMSRKRPGRLSNTPAPRRFCQAHFPVRGAEKAHRCHHCHKNKGERHETVWHCDECGVFLCHNGRDNDCFREFHIKYGPSCDM